MPLPRGKDEGNGAPVLDILQARVRLFDVEEHVEPYTVTRKRDGAEFTLDPGFDCTVAVVDDGEDGEYNGVKFFERYKYKKNGDDKWMLKDNSKLGALAEVVKPGYFEDESISDLTADDLEDFEMNCRIKPKRHPNDNSKILGSQVDWESMRPLRKRPPEQTTDAGEDGSGDDADDPEWDQIPF